MPPVVETRAGTDFTDHDLVARVRAGDDLAFERLYARYHRRIAAYVQGMVKDHGRAEDITQDVFMSALRRMRATERPIAFKPWIYEIAKNACIDAFRRSRRAEEVSYDADDGLARADHVRLVSTGPTPDAAVDTRMSLDHLRGAFGGLSETHHEILVMRELEGLSYHEIGERLGMTRASVESTLFRARRRLTEEYEELASGERCRRVQGIVAGADPGGRRLGARDERRLARHVAHCQPCRRTAALAGFDLAALVERRSVGAKVAAWLPLPAFLRRWVGGGGGHAGSASASSSGGGLAQWTATAAQYAEGAGWVKAAAVAATLAVAGASAGVATHVGGAAGSGAERPAAAGHASPKPAATTGPARAARRSSAPAAGAVHRAARPSSKASRGASAVPAKSRRAASRERRARDGGSGGGSGSGAGGGGTAAHDGGHAAGGASAGGGAAPARPSSGVGGAGASGGPSGGTKPGVKVPSLPASAPKISTPSPTGATNTVEKTVNTVTGTTGGAVKTVTDTVTQTAKDPVGTVSGAVRDPVGTATKTVQSTTNTATNTVNQVADAANNTVKSVTSQAPAPVQKAADTAPQTVKDLTGQAAGAAASTTGTVTLTATDTTKTVTDTTKAATGLLPGG